MWQRLLLSVWLAGAVHGAAYPPSALAQHANGPLFSLESPRFAADLTPSLQADGRTYVQLALQIPYTELQFVKVDAGYGGRIELLFVMAGPKGRRIGDAWEERFVVASFNDTRSPTAVLSIKRRFATPPGKYDIKVQVTDANSRRSATVEGELEVEGLEDGVIGVADPTFGYCPPDTTEHGLRFRQLVTRKYIEGLDYFCALCRVYDASPQTGDPSYEVQYKILDAENRTLAKGDTLVPVTGGGEFYLRPDISELFLGKYFLEVEVERNGKKDKTEGSFEIEAMVTPPRDLWDEMVEALSFLVSRDELDPLRRAETDEERDSTWTTFWAGQDPVLETERNEALIEFVRRVRYANARFRGLGPGWKTDQGRVYIQLGPPDQVEDVGAVEGQQPMQVWHYYELRRQYVFVDRDGFGRYELFNVVNQ